MPIPRKLLILQALPLLALLFGCATVTAGGKTGIEGGRPDTSGILRLLGRGGGSHACPLAPDMVLVNAHVVEPRWPFEPAPLLSYRYSDGAGNSGIVSPVSTERCADLAVMTVRPGDVVRPYPRASTAPLPGDRVWYVGYDWSGKSKAFGERIIHARVLRIVAGHLILDEAGEAGSSGSCVLNQAGQVVAVNAFGRRVGVGEEVGGVVGVWGSWLESCRP